MELDLCFKLINSLLIRYASFTNEIFGQLLSNYSRYAANLNMKAVSFFLLTLYIFNTILSEDYLIKRYTLMKFGTGLKAIIQNVFRLSRFAQRISSINQKLSSTEFIPNKPVRSCDCASFCVGIKSR